MKAHKTLLSHRMNAAGLHVHYKVCNFVPEPRPPSRTTRVEIEKTTRAVSGTSWNKPPSMKRTLYCTGPCNTAERVIPCFGECEKSTDNKAKIEAHQKSHLFCFISSCQRVGMKRLIAEVSSASHGKFWNGGGGGWSPPVWVEIKCGLRIACCFL